MHLYPLHRSYQKLLTNPKNNILCHLNGHAHPPEVDGWHHQIGMKTTPEFTMASLYWQNEYALVTIDNGRLSFHIFDQASQSRAILTYPINDNVTNRVYCENEFSIRLLSFSNSTKKNFFVSGSITGKLLYFRVVKPGVHLFTLNVSLPKGKHFIKISGDADLDCNFSIGTETDPISDRQRTEFRIFPRLYSIPLMSLWIFSVIICIILPESWMRNLDPIHRWLFEEGKGNYFISSIFFGIPLIGYRVRKLSFWSKLLLIFISFSLFFIPIGFFDFDSTVSMWWLFGFVHKGKNYFCLMSLYYVTLYITSVPPLTIFLFSSKFSLRSIIEVCLWISTLTLFEIIGIVPEPHVCFLGRWFGQVQLTIIPCTLR